jgi:hypothetical protein
VRESRWHPTQQLEDTPDGGVIMTVTVASTMEIGRWVREWGDKAEVLEPIILREELREEALHILRQYTRQAKVEKRRRVPKKLPARPAASEPLPLALDPASNA